LHTGPHVFPLDVILTPAPVFNTVTAMIVIKKVKTNVPNDCRCASMHGYLKNLVVICYIDVPDYGASKVYSFNVSLRYCDKEG